MAEHRGEYEDTTAIEGHSPLPFSSSETIRVRDIMGSFIPPEDYGRRLLPQVIDQAAITKPERVAYSFPRYNDPALGFHDVTNRRHANGIDRTAWWMEKGFGKPHVGSFPTIGYIGPNDLRYALLTIAAVKVGYKMMLLSPRNSIDGHLAVTDKCDCQLWILPSQRLGHVDQVLDRRPMTVKPLPELLELLDEDDVPPYPYMKTFDEARQDPFVVLHTSGSTGLPKPIVVPNGSLATVDAHHLLPPVEGRLTQAQYFETPHRGYSTFPNFHSAGMVWCFAMPFWYELSIVLGPAMAPVNLDLINAMFDYGNVDGSLLAPSTLEEISKEPASLERMGKTLFTCFGGGPLSQECGNRINAVCSVFNTVGVTEGSLFPIVQAEREDWNYIHFHPAGGYTFKQRSEELWEQFQTRDRKLDLTQAFFQTFPHIDEFDIKDLYKKHPTKPDRWLYKGRADDVIVLSNGEKLNPLDMEAIINEHPQVKASLVVGQGQFQTAALIQLKDRVPTDNSELQALKDSIWSNIEAANAQAPAHAQLHRDYIMFAADDKPFILAGKETVLRAMTGRLYDADIQEFYAKRTDSSFTNVVCIDMRSLESISTGLCDLVGGILGVPSIGATDDLFASGLDSLSVLKILASIRKSFSNFAPAGQSPVGSSVVYSNPTIEKLAAALHRLTSAGSWVLNGSQSDSTREIEEMVEKYTSTLPKSPRATHATDLVILTGSTGSLGSYLLDDLLRSENGFEIVCLNRAIDGKQRQMKVNLERGIRTEFPSNRVQFLCTDLSKPRFGLDQSTYSKLLEGCTYIIHNQWQVDFNLALSSFEPQIRGVRNLIDFCIESRKNAKLFFISSVGVVSDQKTNDPVAESLISDFSITKGGYGTSKLVSELVLAEAFSRSGVKGKICRIGQIAGPVGTKAGMWNKHEWLPSIIASSKSLGLIPSTLASLNRIEWLPVNVVSKTIIELAGLQDDESDARMNDQPIPVFHTVNPASCSWADLLPTVVSSLGSSVKVVNWSTWLAALQASQETIDPSQNPAIKLLEFYEQADAKASAGLELPRLETNVTAQHSRTLREVEKVGSAWMETWMRQWNF